MSSVTRIMVISDTHTRSLEDLPRELVDQLSQVDYVVHCGDFTHISLLEELRHVAKRFVGVYGNVDPREIREELPAKTVLELEGRKIGVIHPHWGGAPWGIEDDIRKEFEDVDIILFGHTHDTYHKTVNGLVYLNPGQAYPSFRNPASAAFVTIDGDRLHVEMRTFE
ncbi:MAG: YfcE family phosphodiesterase [Chloroflexota bacterium]|nr:YfcE family phosphodiesterase [Chloroflexota bacterium]